MSKSKTTRTRRKQIERDCIRRVAKLLTGVDLSTRRKVYEAIRDAAKIGQYAERGRALGIVGRGTQAYKKIVALSCDEVLDLEL